MTVLHEAVGLLVLTYLVAALVLRSRRPALPIWSIMAFSAFVVTVTGLVPIDEIGKVIDLNVVLFLVGMFCLVSIAESSGLLEFLSYWYVTRFRSRLGLFYASAFLFGLLAALAVNDTVALMGPPIAYLISKLIGVDPRAMFFLLMFSLTVGSAMTPIGNPQNVIVAVRSGMPAPFFHFVVRLAVPTLVNLMLTAYVLARVFRLKNAPIEVGLVPREAIKNTRDAIVASVGLTTAIAVLVLNDVFELLGYPHVKEKGFIPFIIAAGTIIFASSPRRVLAGVDWGTILFFVTMFITMAGVWRSGTVEPLFRFLLPEYDTGAVAVVSIFITSILMSQLLSNVPLVNLYVDYLRGLGYMGKDVNIWLSLAASSTIAGNLTILGAASNVIVLEVLETRYGCTITFKEFLRVGAYVTLINAIVYLLFLLLPLGLPLR